MFSSALLGAANESNGFFNRMPRRGQGKCASVPCVVALKIRAGRLLRFPPCMAPFKRVSSAFNEIVTLSFGLNKPVELNCNALEVVRIRSGTVERRVEESAA